MEDSLAIARIDKSAGWPWARERILRPILRTTIEPWSKKRSHWWDWRPYSPQLTAPVSVSSDYKARERIGLWRRFWLTNFEWQTVVILEPVDHEGPWHLGYAIRGFSYHPQEWCAVVLNGQAAALVGPYVTHFFGLDTELRPVRIRVVRRTTKKDLPASIPLV